MQAQIKFRDKRVGVEKLKKQSKKESSPFGGIIMPDQDEYLGTIRYVSEDAAKDLQVGLKVYFGNQFQNVKMNSTDICVMDDSNVLAVVSEEKPIGQ